MNRCHNLSLSSIDKQLRTCSAEFLNSFILVALGRESGRSITMVDKSIFYLILNLASHTDYFIANIFSSLAIQICRFYCLNKNLSKIKLLYKITVDGFRVRQNQKFCRFLLRYCVGLVLACPISEVFKTCEQTLVTLKTNNTQVKGTQNTLGQSVLAPAFQRLPMLIDEFLWETGNMATNCDLQCRMAACSAILSYVDLLNNEFFDRHSMILIYRFFESANLTDQDDKMMKRKGKMSLIVMISKLSKDVNRRIKPPTWSSSTPDICIRWLIRCISRPNRYLREVSVWLIENLIKELKQPSIEQYVKSKGSHYYEERFFENIPSLEDCSQRELEGLLYSYTWLLRYLNIDEISRLELVISRVQLIISTTNCDVRFLLEQYTELLSQINISSVLKDHQIDQLVQAIMNSKAFNCAQKILKLDNVVQQSKKILDEKIKVKSVSEPELTELLYNIHRIESNTCSLNSASLDSLKNQMVELRLSSSSPGKIRHFQHCLYLVLNNQYGDDVATIINQFDWIDESQPYELVRVYATVLFEWLTNKDLAACLKPEIMRKLAFYLNITSGHSEFKTIVSALIRRLCLKDAMLLWRFDANSENVCAVADLFYAAINNSKSGFSDTVSQATLSLVCSLLNHDAIDKDRQILLFDSVPTLVEHFIKRSIEDTDDKLIYSIYKFFNENFPIKRQEIYEKTTMKMQFERTVRTLSDGIVSGLLALSKNEIPQILTDLFKFLFKLFERGDRYDKLERNMLQHIVSTFATLNEQYQLQVLCYLFELVVETIERFLRPFLMVTKSCALIDFAKSIISDLVKQAADYSEIQRAMIATEMLQVIFLKLNKPDLQSEHSQIAYEYSVKKYNGFSDPKILLKDCIKLLRKNVVQRDLCSQYGNSDTIFLHLLIHWSRGIEHLKSDHIEHDLEDPQKHEFIFDGLIDHNRQYKFDKVVETQQESTDDENLEGLTMHPPTDSQVQLQLDQFDFNMSGNVDVLRSSVNSTLNANSSVIDQHECMQSFVSLIKFMSTFCSAAAAVKFQTGFNR
ncbi:hypothetical protein ACOME3_005684 [Neoechinorhynchus agilis]